MYALLAVTSRHSCEMPHTYGIAAIWYAAGSGRLLKSRELLKQYEATPLV